MIFRHAEKPDSGPLLSPTGQARAQAYVPYFTNNIVGRVAGRPDCLIAGADSEGSSRPRLTLEPLSAAMRLPIDLKFKDKDTEALADALHHKRHGRTILICWRHGKIPELVAALGADPDSLLPKGKWPEHEFGWVLQLRFDHEGRLIPDEAIRLSPHLLPGDY